MKKLTDLLKQSYKNSTCIVIVLMLIPLSYLYKDVFLHNKILFPSNFLVTFYSPWSTHRYPEYPNGIPHKPIGGNDQVRMFYPYRTFVSESIKKGEWPLWNPYNFAGSPIIANFQSAFFYPLNLLYLILPQITAWSILTAVQPILGTWFMYLYLKLFIKQKQASLLGSISFGFSGFILAWSQENAVVGHAGLWLPLILYATEKLLQNLSKKYHLLLVFSLFSCLLAGHYQFSFYVLLLTSIYTVYRITQTTNKRSHILNFVSAYLFMFGLAAVQLLPSIEAFTQSPRSSTSSASVVSNYLMPITHFINALVPDIYGSPGSYNYFGRGFYQESVFYAGIIPAIFALFSLKYIKNNPNATFFKYTLVITFVLAINSPLTLFLFNLPIPIISTFTPSRILMLTSAALSIVGAYGFSYWLEEQTAQNKKNIIKLILLICTIIFIWVGVIYAAAVTQNKILVDLTSYSIRPMNSMEIKNAKISIRNSIIPLGMLVSLLIIVFLQDKRQKISYIVIILTYLGQIYFLNKYLVVGNKEFLYPSHFIFSDIQSQQEKSNRFLSFGSPILGNVALDKKVYSPDGIDPVFQSRYGQLIYAAKNNGKYTTNIPRIEANLSEYAENGDIIDNPRRLRLISLLGVTRIYNYEPSYKNSNQFEKIFPPTQFTKLWNKEGWQAYQNTTMLPRAFVVSDYVIENDPQIVFDKIFDQQFDLKKIIILSEKPEKYTPNQTEKDNSTVEIKKYEQQYIEIKATTASDQLLFLSDNYYPGWQATIDNKPTKILRANYTFRAVVVPKGEHTIRYKFNPYSFKIGLLISLASAIFLVIFYLKLHTTRKNLPPDNKDI